jgi:secreted trypsin-like serine protease
MKLILKMFVLALCTPLSFASANSSIIGGTTVDANDWIAHTVVAFVSTNSQSQALCTASLVADDLAITAAHCIVDDPSAPKSIYTLIFSTNIKNAQATLLRQIDKVEIPSEWNPGAQPDKNTSDVALVHFTGGLPTGYVYSDLLPFDQTLSAGQSVELAGYGISDATANTGAGILRKTTVTVLDPHYSPSEISFDQSKGGGACHGDSGGPAYFVIDNHPYLFGITSRGGGNCDQDVVYTEIAAYQAWFTSAVAAIRR